MAVVSTVQEKYMKEALRQAKKAYALGEVPIAVSLYMKAKLSGVGTTGATQIKILWRTPRSPPSTKPAGSSATGGWRTARSMSPWNPARCAPEPSCRRESPRWSWAA